MVGSFGDTLAVDADDLAFAGAAAQARMLADGDVSAPELLEIYRNESRAWTASCVAIAWC